MKKVVEEIKELHREIDDMLDEKLRAIDECMENPRECPCGEGRCELEPDKFDDIEGLYDKLFEDEKIERAFAEAREDLEWGLTSPQKRSEKKSNAS